MNTNAVLHKGDLLTCVVCNPESKQKQEKRLRKTKTKMTGDGDARRQVTSEIGEAEPTKDQRFQLLQKYGVTAPRIDRQITQPAWMGVAEWKRKLNDWYKATKGLVTQTPRLTSKPYSQYPGKAWNSHKNNPLNRPKGTRTSRPNYGLTKTAIRQS